MQEISIISLTQINVNAVIYKSYIILVVLIINKNHYILVNLHNRMQFHKIMNIIVYCIQPNRTELQRILCYFPWKRFASFQDIEQGRLV